MAKFNKSLVAGAVAVAFGVSAGLAQAGSKELVEKMYELGKINDAEYKELSDAAKPADNELLGKYKGGFKWQTADGSSKFQVAGRAQLDYYDYNHDEEEDTFGMRRVYLGVKAQIDDIWKLEVTYNPDANQLEYGYLDYAPSKAFTARFGAQKFYAGFEEGTSSRFVDFLERSVADGLQPGKQIGIQLFGEPVKKTFFYALGYYNGEGVNADENGNDADGKDTMIALAMNGASFLSDSKDLVAHIGYAVSSGNRNALDADGNPIGAIFEIDGEARGDTWGALNLVAGPTEFNRGHQNVSLMFAKGPFKFQHEDTQVDFDSSAQNDTLKANYTSVTWLITGEHYAKSYSLKGMKGIKPKSPVTKSGGMGAWEVGYRTSTFDAQDASQAGNWSTATDLVKTTTLGLKFIPNEKVRFMVNSVKTKYNVPVVAVVGNEKAITFRAQVDF